MFHTVYVRAQIYDFCVFGLDFLLFAPKVVQCLQGINKPPMQLGLDNTTSLEFDNVLGFKSSKRMEMRPHRIGEKLGVKLQKFGRPPTKKVDSKRLKNGRNWLAIHCHDRRLAVDYRRYLLVPTETSHLKAMALIPTRTL